MPGTQTKGRDQGQKDTPGAFDESQPKKGKGKRNRYDSEMLQLIKYAEQIFQDLLGADYPYSKSLDWRVQIIVDTCRRDRNVLLQLLVMFVREWVWMQKTFNVAKSSPGPTLDILASIGKFILPYVGTQYFKEESPYTAFLDKSGFTIPEWLEKLQNTAKKEREANGFSNKVNRNTWVSGSKTPTTGAEAIDLACSKYACAIIENSGSCMDDEPEREIMILSGNYMEPPGDDIEFGYDRDRILVQHSTPSVFLDHKGLPLLPVHSIKVNGPGSDPVLSKFFGYVPDGKYLRSQFSSPEAFEHHKLLCAEALAFFTTLPAIYSRVVHQGGNGFRRLSGIADSTLWVSIRQSISEGMPVLGILTQMVQDMGFGNITEYWDWYIKVYDEYIFVKWSSPKFESYCHKRKPFYTFDLHHDGFLGLNPCEEILDTEWVNRLYRTEPPMLTYKWHCPKLYKYVGSECVDLFES